MFKKTVELLRRGVDLVRRMQHIGNMKNVWIIFDHVKRLHDWTTMSPMACLQQQALQGIIYSML